MKKKGNCDQCGERRDLSDTIESTFHRHFKYRDMPIRFDIHIRNSLTGDNMFLCKSCKLDVMRAMKDGGNWE